MSKKAAKAAKNLKKAHKKGGAGGKMSLKARMIMIVLILIGLAFLPTSMLLCVGMLPSLIAVFISAKGVGARASTVTAMNLAGCIPFVFQLWQGEHSFESSMDMLSDPMHIVIMYTAAAFGYMIDFVVTGVVSSFMYQKGELRLKTIKKRQEKLVKQWGEAVTGAVSEE